MTVAEAVHAIESVGGRVRLKGDRIRYRIPNPTPEPVAEAVEVLRQRKPEALALLGWQPAPAAESRWPSECLAAERQFRIPAGRFYPLLDHEVLTPAGVGILKQVFADRVEVHLKGEPRTRQFRPEEITVAADVRQARGAKPC